ncbi:phosphomannomutase [Defluviimonas salinarum]|uniref:Phosphomannomutase n=1 Tax=Defluviimonas salinarum TaxID=2992147 RepID=A0ABT3IXC2_9RHOB|nr:phosphomannomutase [Defluviimonas salinarum]MCW3780080.1 phosphomannomutase [Defluviimonas salinarum]
MTIGFGTSGLRGPVADLTDAICAANARAFLQAVPHSGLLMLARDLRPSSPRISAAVAAGAASLGVAVRDCGTLPTPALALAAMAAGVPAIMVTGSHIPADRNGLKFFTARGEITKADETAIRAALRPPPPMRPVCPETDAAAGAGYLARYGSAFARDTLAGMRLGLYEHSSVARDLLAGLLAALGAEVVPLGRSTTFVPLDTEAIDTCTAARLAGWAATLGLDAIVSTDGDGDRPLVADAAGHVIAGDILGTLTAAALGADIVVTPVTSNSLIETSGRFARTRRTRIGSPHVIAAMAEAMARPGPRVAGFEANGGFLLGYTAETPAGRIAPLMTRDAVLPILVPLAEAARRRLPLSALVAELPGRRTASDRLAGIAPAQGEALIQRLVDDPAARARFFAAAGPEAAIDRTDGLRLRFANGAIAHLRPSGNAPEFRCYAEAEDQEAADHLLGTTLDATRRALG